MGSRDTPGNANGATAMPTLEERLKSAEDKLRAANATGNADAIVKAKNAYVRAARRVRDNIGPHVFSASVLAMIAE